MIVQTGTIGSEKKQIQRDLDKYLGDLYRNDNSVHNMTFSQYKKMWRDAQKLNQMKFRYSIFEPMPDETALEFKKRLKSIVLVIPIETIKQYEERIRIAFNE